ncbi:MAG: bL21 family ribosomal protein, partial [Thermoguttaceae bacterium]|nr:bL21 family ribosomal protein [Thermoguttaceae bacterium]
ISSEKRRSGEIFLFLRFFLRRPTVPSAKIIAEAPTKEKGPKFVVRRFRRRKNSRKKTGAVKRTPRSKSKTSSKAEFNSSVRA